MSVHVCLSLYRNDSWVGEQLCKAWAPAAAAARPTAAPAAAVPPGAGSTRAMPGAMRGEAAAARRGQAARAVGITHAREPCTVANRHTVGLSLLNCAHEASALCAVMPIGNLHGAALLQRG